MMKYYLIIFLLNIINLSCESSMPIFSGEDAFNHLVRQCDFGPRNPGSEGHQKTKNYIMQITYELADTVFVQEFDYKVEGTIGEFQGSNIIARYNINAEFQVILGAHWDTRPWADRDKNKSNERRAILGANDGASGVAVLLELARILKYNHSPIGVSLVFFDAEDSGVSGINETYCKGSIYFSKNLPFKGVNEAIILDMVGDKQLSFPIERYSLRYHKKLVRNLWKRAKELGLDAFKGNLGPAIYDDHIPLNVYANIPAIDIIDFEYPNSYINYWHTMEDIPENCSPKSLEQVGKLMIDYIYNRKFYNTD